MKIFRFIIPVVVVGLGWVVMNHLIRSKPEARRFSAPPAQTHVDATALHPSEYQVVVQSQGTVKARTESTLIPEVAGVIVKVSPRFHDGGFFEAGELLLMIDPSDYETAMTVAQASLTESLSNLEEEQALAEQALADWKKLGGEGEPNALALRKPQLAKAEAAVASARARLSETERDLKRTTIRAPYAGRILTKQVDIGQYVSPGTLLASIYAVDYAEIRLPLSNRQMSFVDVPERFRGEEGYTSGPGPKVRLTAKVGGRSIAWDGTIVRAEGAIDTRSRQQYVIAQVDNPYARRGPNQPPLKVGMFVQAKITGTELNGVYVIPRSALRPNDEILTVDKDNRLQRKQVEIDWRDEDNVVVSKGVHPGMVLCLTSLPFAAENALVVPDIDGEGPRMLESQKPQGGGPGGWKGKGGKGGPGGGKGKGKGGPPTSKKKGDWKGKKGGS